jgi:hypothetical protein
MGEYEEQCLVRPYVKCMWISVTELYVSQFGRNIDTIVQTNGVNVDGSQVGYQLQQCRK